MVTIRSVTIQSITIIITVTQTSCCSKTFCTLHTMTSFTNIIMGYLEESRGKNQAISQLQRLIREEQQRSENKDNVIEDLTSEVFRQWNINADMSAQLRAKTRVADELEHEVDRLQAQTNALELEVKQSKEMAHSMSEKMKEMDQNLKAMQNKMKDKEETQ